MKRIIAAAVCIVMMAGLAGCGNDNNKGASSGEVARISPETLISAETASAAAGTTLTMSEEGVVQDGNMLTVTYVPDPIGSYDSVGFDRTVFRHTLIISDMDRIRK